jgi:hypothetical protein
MSERLTYGRMPLLYSRSNRARQIVYKYQWPHINGMGGRFSDPNLPYVKFGFFWIFSIILLVSFIFYSDIIALSITLNDTA